MFMDLRFCPPELLHTPLVKSEVYLETAADSWTDLSGTSWADEWEEDRCKHTHTRSPYIMTSALEPNTSSCLDVTGIWYDIMAFPPIRGGPEVCAGTHADPQRTGPSFKHKNTSQRREEQHESRCTQLRPALGRLTAVTGLTDLDLGFKAFWNFKTAKDVHQEEHRDQIWASSAQRNPSEARRGDSNTLKPSTFICKHYKLSFYSFYSQICSSSTRS